MKIISWNLNGLLSCVKHGSFHPDAFHESDVVCCQEIRTKQKPSVMAGYQHFWNPSQRDGYSGTLTMAKRPPLQVIYGLGDKSLDLEGRVLTLEYTDFFVVNAYAPNSQKDLIRHQFRLEWDEAFRLYVQDLTESKPVIACGDFNVALTDIDIYPENLRQYWAQQGYASDERSNLETLLDCGFIDAFRYVYPHKEGAYTWWSNRRKKRDENRGWRLDYFFLSNDLIPQLTRVEHLTHIAGSDHCPILLEVKEL